MCNVSNLCRLCAGSNTKVTPIFGKDGVAQNLADKIHTHLPIVVTPDDCMPIAVCADCISALDICHNLLRSCVSADERLRQVLGLEEDPDHTSALDELKKVANAKLEKNNEDDDNIVRESDDDFDRDNDNDNDQEGDDDHGGDNDRDDGGSEEAEDNYIYDSEDVVQAIDDSTVYLKEEIVEIEDEELGKSLEGDEVVVVMLEYDPDQEQGSENVFIEESNSKESDEAVVEKETKKQGIKFSEKVLIKVPDFKWTSILMCDKCGDPFRSLKQLFQHKSYAHNIKDPLQCPACEQLLTTKQAYVEHVKEHLPDTPLGLICPVCSRESKSKELFKHHLKGHATPNSLDCPLCTSVFADRATLEEHLDKHVEEQTDASTTDKKSSQQWVCHECGYTCSRSLNLQRHLMRHEREKSDRKKQKGKRTSECRVCGKQFESFWYLVRHRSDEHTREEVEAALQQQGLERESFECNICGKLLSCQYTLNHHLEAHSGVRNFVCTYCDKGFAYKAQLKSHTLIHTGSQYTCSDCPKQFRNAYALRVHRRTHTGEKPFQCEQCPKAFHSRANYEQHLQIHSEVRKYKCTYCTYRARRPEALKTHIRTHTNERPYACKVCGRAFKQKYDCKKHEDLHYRNPGAFLRQRWPKSSKNIITVPQSDNTESDSQQGGSKVKADEEETTIRVVEVRGTADISDEQMDCTDGEGTVETVEVAEEATEETVTKIYEYHEGGMREIVISQVPLAEGDKPVIWTV